MYVSICIVKPSRKQNKELPLICGQMILRDLYSWCVGFINNGIFCSITICLTCITQTQMCDQGFSIICLCVCVFHDFQSTVNSRFRQCFLFAKIQEEELEAEGILWSNSSMFKEINKNADRKWLKGSLILRYCKKSPATRKSLPGKDVLSPRTTKAPSSGSF